MSEKKIESKIRIFNLKTKEEVNAYSKALASAKVHYIVSILESKDGTPIYRLSTVTKVSAKKREAIVEAANSQIKQAL